MQTRATVPYPIQYFTLYLLPKVSCYDKWLAMSINYMKKNSCLATKRVRLFTVFLRETAKRFVALR